MAEGREWSAMDSARKKQLKEQYKARKVTGGIYRIVNKDSGRFYLNSTDDMQATRNWFESCRMFNTCSIPHIQKDWKELGMDAFALEEVDYIDKGETQTNEEYREDLKALLELWDEKLPKENRY